MNYPIFSTGRALKILENFDEQFGDISIVLELSQFTSIELNDITSNSYSPDFDYL